MFTMSTPAPTLVNYEHVTDSAKKKRVGAELTGVAGFTRVKRKEPSHGRLAADSP